MDILTVWLLFNSVLISLAIFAIFILARQVGVLLNHVGPVGARQTNQGPRLGENISLQTNEILGLTLEKPTILIFGSSSCAVCTLIKEAALKLYQYWNQKSSFVFVYDDDVSDFMKSKPNDISVIENNEFRLALDIKMLPFAIMIDKTGKVVAQGLVNDISNLESLLEAVN